MFPLLKYAYKDSGQHQSLLIDSTICASLFQNGIAYRLVYLRGIINFISKKCQPEFFITLLDDDSLNWFIWKRPREDPIKFTEFPCRVQVNQLISPFPYSFH